MQFPAPFRREAKPFLGLVFRHQFPVMLKEHLWAVTGLKGDLGGALGFRHAVGAIRMPQSVVNEFHSRVALLVIQRVFGRVKQPGEVDPVSDGRLELFSRKPRLIVVESSRVSSLNGRKASDRQRPLDMHKYPLRVARIRASSFANFKRLLFVSIAAFAVQPCFAAIKVFKPTLNPMETVVAFATPQDYGAAGDGTTDDTAAFQKAMDAAHDAGGGVIFVPAGNYAFHSTLNIPYGVTLHGDWKDWTAGTGGCVGTTFKIYAGGGESAGTPFISMRPSTGLWGINFWYPDQNPAKITPYPFTIKLSGDLLVQNVALINSYQGIQANDASHHMLQTIIGSPLLLGITADEIYDVCHINDLRFSPNVWPASKLAGAPAVGGAHAKWMRANGTGVRLLRIDGESCMATYISGYKIGLEFNASSHGAGGCSFYQGAITDCGTALFAQVASMAAGVPFTWFTLDGDVAVNRTSTEQDGSLAFSNCAIIGRSGTAVNFTGKTWASMVQFQNSTITGTIKSDGCIFNLVSCNLIGSPQCVMSPSATTRASFIGCTFSPAQSITNNGNPANLMIDARKPVANVLPQVPWSIFTAQYASCQPAKTTLFLSSAYGAKGNGTTDDTAAIQRALTAAGSNGGGIVYLQPGKYKTTNTLVVPSGVRLQGPFEGRHTPCSEGAFIRPFAGKGKATGPVALALSANSGVIGVNFSYESQTSACTPFPPTIQGRGANVYAIGVMCPNAYIYVDLNTYTCKNHFFDMVDGWAVSRGFLVGNGSSGTLLNIGANWTYWIGNYGSQSNLGSDHKADNAAFFGRSYLQWQTMGDCTEIMANVFAIPTHNLVYCADQNGKGPNLICINVQQDGSVQGYIFDSAAVSTIKVVNATCCLFTDTKNPSPLDKRENTVYIKTTPRFKGTARFFNAASWGGPIREIVMGGGDLGLDLYYTPDSGSAGIQIDGGVFHLVNYGNPSQEPLYTINFGTNAGIAGKTNEVIGNYSYHGVTYKNPKPGNPVNAWGNFAASNSGPQNGSVYHLVCENSGKAIDNGGFSDDGSSLVQWEDGSNVNQEWKLVDIGGGYFHLVSVQSGKAVDNGGSTSDGTGIKQKTVEAGNTSQGWKFVNVGGMYPFHVVNQKSEKALDNTGANSNGKSITQSRDNGAKDTNQNWRLVLVR